MSEPTIVTARNRLSNNAIHIQDALRGNLAGAACYDCGEILIAKKGMKRIPHFAHKNYSNCSGESNLHKYAKHVLYKQRQICLRNYPQYKKPSRHKFDYASVEHPMGKFRIDCLLYDEELPQLAVEIKVTHSTQEEKIAAFRKNGIAAVEIDLSRLSRQPSITEIEREVCEHHCNVNWLYNPKHDHHNIKRVEQIYRETGFRIDI